MATQIIDTSLHGAAFPATYTGPGNLIGNCVQSGGEACDVYGNFTSSTGNTAQINCGFQALQVDIVDVTGAITWHWQYGMPATNSVKITLGTVAGVLDTSGAITVSSDPAGNTNVTLSTTVCGNAKNICFHVQG
jgi:hypothetical protein